MPHFYKVSVRYHWAKRTAKRAIPLHGRKSRRVPAACLPATSEPPTTASAAGQALRLASARLSEANTGRLRPLLVEAEPGIGGRLFAALGYGPQESQVSADVCCGARPLSSEVTRPVSTRTRRGASRNGYTSRSGALLPQGSLERAARAASDTTPPAAPAGLRAKTRQGSVTLAWEPNGEADLAGYHDHRAMAAGLTGHRSSKRRCDSTGNADELAVG